MQGVTLAAPEPAPEGSADNDAATSATRPSGPPQLKRKSAVPQQRGAPNLKRRSVEPQHLTPSAPTGGVSDAREGPSAIQARSIRSRCLQDWLQDWLQETIVRRLQRYLVLQIPVINHNSHSLRDVYLWCLPLVPTCAPLL